MIAFFDSSVLIGVIYADSPEHKACVSAWSSHSKKAVYSHGLLETFSQLTGGRLGNQVSADVAAMSISRNLAGVDVVSLGVDEMLDHLRDTRNSGIRGGAIYDLMHLCAARKARAGQIFTLNKRHFVAIAPELAPKIFNPLDL